MSDTPSLSPEEQQPLPCPFCGTLPVQDDADGVWFMHDSPSPCVLDGNRFTLTAWNRRYSGEAGPAAQATDVCTAPECKAWCGAATCAAAPLSLPTPVSHEFVARRHSGEAGPTTATLAKLLESESKGIIKPDRIRELILSSPTAAAIYNYMRHEHARGSSGDCRDAERMDWLEARGHVLAEPHFTPDTGAVLDWERGQYYDTGNPTAGSLREAIDAAMAASPSSETPRPCDHRSPRRDCSVCCDAILNLYFTARDAYAAGEASSPTPPTDGVGVAEACHIMASLHGGESLTLVELRGVLGLVDWESRKSHLPSREYWSRVGAKIRRIIGEG